MSLATLGTKLHVTHRHHAATPGRAVTQRYGREAQLSAGRALTRHVVLGALALGCAAYGLFMAMVVA